MKKSTQDFIDGFTIGMAIIVLIMYIFELVLKAGSK
jgi:hypothetical protein